MARLLNTVEMNTVLIVLLLCFANARIVKRESADVFASENSIVEVRQTKRYDDNRKDFEIICEMTPNRKPNLGYFSGLEVVKTIVYRGCPPMTSYLHATRIFNLNLNEESVLKIEDLIPGPGFAMTSFTELPVTNVAISGDSRGSLQLNSLHLDVKKLSLANGISTQPFGSDSCSKLNYLSLENWKIDTDATQFLKHCDNINTLSITNSTPIVGLPSQLQELTLAHNDLSSGLDTSKLDLKRGLILLNITGCRLSHIDSHVFNGKSIRSLVLSGNSLSGDAVMSLKNIHDLTELDLSNNPMTDDICNHIGSVAWPHLQTLNLAGTGLTKFCVTPFNSIKRIIFSNNGITQINLADLLKSKSKNVEQVHFVFKDNPIDNISLDDSTLQRLSSMRNSLKIIINEDYDCNKLSKNLKSALKTDLLTIYPLDCFNEYDEESGTPSQGYDDRGPTNERDGGHYGPTEKDDKESKWQQCSDGVCDCRIKYDGERQSSCRRHSTSTIPRMEGVQKIFASNNQIETIQVEDIPRSLKWLDVSYNKISVVNQEVAKLLFEGPLSLDLTGNPIDCGCKNIALLSELKNHSSRVKRYEQLRCSNDKKVKYIDLETLCENSSDIGMIVTPSMSILVISLLFLHAGRMF